MVDSSSTLLGSMRARPLELVGIRPALNMVLSDEGSGLTAPGGGSPVHPRLPHRCRPNPGGWGGFLSRGRRYGCARRQGALIRQYGDQKRRPCLAEGPAELPT